MEKVPLEHSLCIPSPPPRQLFAQALILLAVDSYFPQELKLIFFFILLSLQIKIILGGW